MSAIVKYFPKNYTVHRFGTLERFNTSGECWMIIEHLGQAEDGFEIYEQLVKQAFPSKQQAIKEFQQLRAMGRVE